MIEAYDFGTVTISGKEYTSDVIVHGDRVTSWWRDAGHSVSRNDLEGLLLEKPAVIVFGTGAYGAMQVPRDIRRFVEDRGIQLMVERSADAVHTFNRLRDKGGDVAIAMHLTC